MAAIEIQQQLGDEAFWRMTNILFENRRTLGREQLLEHAASLGADRARMEAALEQETHLPVIRTDMRAILAIGQRIGTPAFLIGTRLVMGARDYRVFEAAVRAELADGPEAAN